MRDELDYRDRKGWHAEAFCAPDAEDLSGYLAELRRCSIDLSRRLSVLKIGFGNGGFVRFCLGGKLDQFCRPAGLRVVAVRAQAVPLRGIGLRAALRRAPVVVLRRVISRVLRMACFGGADVVIDPNMVAVLERSHGAEG